MIAEYNNARAIVARWKTLADEARALGSNAEADGLDAHVKRTTLALDEVVAQMREYDAINKERDVAYAEKEEVARAINESRVPRDALYEPLFKLNDLDRKLLAAQGAVVRALARVEKSDAVVTGAYRRAKALIENIVDCCLTGFGQEWIAANRDLDDVEAAKWEPVCMARAIAEYPTLARHGLDAWPLDHLLECFAHRAAQRGRSIRRPLPTETITNHKPASDAELEFSPRID